MIGLACDGLGYGTDGVIWGGESLVARLTGSGAAATWRRCRCRRDDRIRQPWRMAAAWLRRRYPQRDLGVARRNPGWTTVGRPATSPELPPTFSAGRLFDAVAAIAGIRDAVHYEGQAAIELEQAAARIGSAATRPSPRAGCGPGPISSAGRRRRARESAPPPSRPLHNGLAGLLARAGGRPRHDPASTPSRSPAGCSRTCCCCAARSRVGVRRVPGPDPLPGPPNDAGVSLGQVAVAAARDALGDLVGGWPSCAGQVRQRQTINSTAHRCGINDAPPGGGGRGRDGNRGPRRNTLCMYRDPRPPTG